MENLSCSEPFRIVIIVSVALTTLKGLVLPGSSFRDTASSSAVSVAFLGVRSRNT